MDKWMDGWMSGCMDKWMKNQKRRLHTRLKATFPVFPDIYAEIPGVYKTYLPKTFFYFVHTIKLAISLDRI